MFIYIFSLLFILPLLRSIHAIDSDLKKPNIIFIMADDLGWNDVGFHGMNQIPTPNIDALAFSGLALHNYYVTPICTPSRSALMTGKYPIHTGMQHAVLYGAEPRGLPLSEKLLPQYLKELGYSTHLVGKWHLGSYKKAYTPLYRGFDSHLGFWNGKIDLFDHTSVEHGFWGVDFRRDMSVAWDLFGRYATDVYTEESVRLISLQNSSQPMFLMIAHSAMHSGNPYTPLRAPDSVIDKFVNITDPNRRKYAGMLTKLDESVGKVIEALERKEMLNNSIVIFTTDNGGPAAGFNMNAASNYPLRGVKNTLWEGGVRGAACIWTSKAPGSKPKTRAAKQMMHISDWLPTLVQAAGGSVQDLGKIDGVSVWDALWRDETSPRVEILHNIDDLYGSASLTSGDWKIHKGTNYNGQWDGWYGPDGRKESYDIDMTYNSPAGKALKRLDAMPDKNSLLQTRNELTLNCDQSLVPVDCEPLKKPCLFNVRTDPCERRNMADAEPERLESLLQLLDKYNRTAVPPSNLPDDPFGNPANWNHVYTNFGDYENLPSTPKVA